MFQDSQSQSVDRSAAQQRFLSLFLRSEREIFRYVAALVPNVADAEDIVQQTALTLWEKFEAYDANQPFTPWACRFALNKTKQWVDRRQRWRVLLEDGLAGELAQRRVEFRIPSGAGPQRLGAGQGSVAGPSGATRAIAASRAEFASLFDLQTRSSDAAVLRHEQWRSAGSRLDEDPSLLVHFDFESGGPPDWRLPNSSKRQDAAVEATVVGCHWTEGRWPDKRALEFRGVGDRVRLDVAGEYESLTLATWVRVQGLDRQINSIFMSDGFEAGTLHWSVRDDGVMALTAIGPGAGEFQIVTTPPVLALDQFGLWVHLAVTVEGPGRRVVQFVNGFPVGTKDLKASQPFRIGAAEIGNWNARGFPGDDPFHIRNFSGAMDDFCLFGRALGEEEIRGLYARGKPQSDSAVPNHPRPSTRP